MFSKYANVEVAPLTETHLWNLFDFAWRNRFLFFLVLKWQISASRFLKTCKKLQGSYTLVYTVLYFGGVLILVYCLYFCAICSLRADQTRAPMSEILLVM